SQQHGLLPTSLGIKRVSECFGRGLDDFDAFLPVIEAGLIVPDYLVPNSADELNTQAWDSLLRRSREVDDPHLLGKAYAAAARYVPEPAEITCVGPQGIRILPPNEVVVAEQGVDES